MNSFFSKLKTIFTEKGIRNRILFVIAVLFIFRFLAVIPVPGVDTTQLSSFLAGNQFLGLFNVLSGGGLSTFSIIMLGVSPYITASIIMQLLGTLVPSMKEMLQESGEMGRRKFNQITRIITVPFAALQAFGYLKLLQNQGVIPALPVSALVTNVLIIVAGSMLLLWLAELINEFGIGNGTSLIIMAGIVAQLPSTISQFFFTFTIDQLPTVLLYLAIGIVVIVGVVFIYEAERPIRVTYSRQVRGIRTLGGNDTYLPLRLTQAGVMPIIFASSLFIPLQFLAGMWQNASSVRLQAVSHVFQNFLQSTVLYAIVYFLLVVFFTYFYTAVTFNPGDISTNLQKNGGFIPGTRPGEATTGHLATIVNRITLVGSVFLGLVAVLPIIVRSATGITAFAIGGTSLLITVSVVIDLIRRLDAQVAMYEY